MADKTPRIYTVSEITQDIKLVLESAFGQVWVEGEISNAHPHASGHFYFSLKDKGAVLPAAIFNQRSKGIKFQIENGLKVVCFGKIDLYPPHGAYKLVVEKIEPKGIGGLQLALEQLKEKLEKEGLFKEEHKRPIPYLPSMIGIVTSAEGAALKDILKVLERRFKDVHIIINSVHVQGELAKQEIAAAIREFNLYNQASDEKEQIEVLIVGRGGGSMEDLWAFNEEIVARAIYNSKIPVISAVGHERDWTIADLVADLRAATPSVAAELVIPKKEELMQRLADLGSDLERSFLDLALGLEETLKALNRHLAMLNPAALIQQHQSKIFDLAGRILMRMQHFLQMRESLFAKSIEKLNALSPLNILSRGYSITFKMPEAKIVKDARTISAGDILKTRLHKGEAISQVKEVLPWQN